MSFDKLSNETIRERNPLFVSEHRDVKYPDNLTVQTIDVQCFHCHRHTRFMHDSVISAECAMLKDKIAHREDFIEELCRQLRAKDELIKTQQKEIMR